MIIYISGPITGMPDENKKAFQKAQNDIVSMFKTIKTEKVKILNPIKIGMKLEKKFAVAGKRPKWDDYMRVCIKELCEATYIYLLPEWWKSDGANFERHIANRLKIPCAENIQELSKLILRKII